MLEWLGVERDRAVLRRTDHGKQQSSVTRQRTQNARTACVIMSGCSCSENKLVFGLQPSRVWTLAFSRPSCARISFRHQVCAPPAVHIADELCRKGEYHQAHEEVSPCACVPNTAVSVREGNPFSCYNTHWLVPVSPFQYVQVEVICRCLLMLLLLLLLLLLLIQLLLRRPTHRQHESAGAKRKRG